MSEQDRVDSPEDDEVEAHKRRMNDDAESGWDDFEAHKRHPSASEEPDSSDSDDFEAHKRHPQ
jgi:hypothetical protein